MAGYLFSVILPVKNEGLNIKMTVDSLLRAKGDFPCEIIVVDDCSDDGCCTFLTDAYYRRPDIKLVTTAGLGSANARNAGSEAASGEIFVFCDAHVTVPPDFFIKMEKTFASPVVSGLSPAIASLGDIGAAGYGQTWNNRLEAKWLPAPKDVSPVPLLPGGCQAFRRAAYEKVGGYERGFRVWGREDEEISFKMWLFGFNLYVDPSIRVLHLFRPAHPYAVSGDDVNYNFLRMAALHLNEKRMAAAFSLLGVSHHFSRNMASLCLSDVWARRADYLSRRIHDDNWFMGRFNIPF